MTSENVIERETVEKSEPQLKSLDKKLVDESPRRLCAA